MSKLRVAVVGTGFIGPVHAEAVRRNPDLAELTAIAGSSAETAEAAAAKLNVPYHTGDYRDLLNRDDVDVVHICTPNYLHYPMVKECLNSGKHVLCEKPLSMSSEEARELTLLAEKQGLKTAVNYNLRYYPMVQEMQTRNTEKDAGTVFAVQGVYLQDWLLHETDYSWRLESKMSGSTRAVADIGTHWMDMAQFITGLRIEKVFARFSRMHDTRKKRAGGRDHTFEHGAPLNDAEYVSYAVDTEDYAQMLFVFEGGVQGSLTVSQVSAGYKNFMEYRQMGTGASYSWNSEAPNRMTIGRRDGANEILMKDPSLLHPRAASMSAYPGGHQEGYGETLKYILRDFYADILGLETGAGESNYPTFRDGTSEMVLCEAILRSVESGQWADVEDVR